MSPRASASTSRVSWVTVTVALSALGVSALLWGAALFMREQVFLASQLVARGMGEAIGLAGWEAFRQADRPPNAELLQGFLDAHAEEGLRYVGIVSWEGQVVAEAGRARGTAVAPGAFEAVNGRVRILRFLGPQRRPEGPHPEGAPAPDEGPRRRGPRYQVAYEFEPLTANALEARARWLVVVAAVSTLGLAALAFALSRLMSQRERLQLELERGRRLATLGEMSAVLAHELRNPLTSLKGHAQLLVESVSELESQAASPSEQAKRLRAKGERLVSEAVRLERLTNDLLAFVKSGELQWALCEPARVLEAAAEAVGAQSVELTVPEGAVVWRLDAGRVQQALENVLRNAIQASAGGQRVQAGLEVQAGEQLTFTVRDFGPGIPAEDKERIFEPFVTGRTRGAGLGLAITRRIVELHGGSVSAANAEGGGARFALCFPKKGG